MNEDEATFLAEVKEAVHREDDERLSDAVSEFSEFCFDEPPDVSGSPEFSEDFIDELAGVLKSQEFLRMENSFKLLALFQNDWGRLNSDQRKNLISCFVDIFKRLTDNTSHLIIAELLGENLADADGFQALTKICETKNEVARAHVAHGFKRLALSASDQDLRKKAKAKLAALAKDSSDIVRAEVAAALSDLARSG